MSIFINHYETGSAAPRPWIAGVCATLAGLCAVEAWMVRLPVILLLLWHPLWFVVLYLAAAAFIRNENAPIARRRYWFSRLYSTAPSGGGREDGLSALDQKLAALDRRLASLEAIISAPDDMLRQKFRNL